MSLELPAVSTCSEALLSAPQDAQDRVLLFQAVRVIEGQIETDDGKPLAFVVQAAEKVYVTLRLEVTNPGGHSSLPRRDNAIYELAEALLRLQAHEFPVSLGVRARLEAIR